MSGKTLADLMTNSSQEVSEGSVLKAASHKGSGDFVVVAKQKWLFVTNHINLTYMLAAGMITSPAGFEKYYNDTLNLHPGWVPLFQNIVPEQALEEVVKDARHLAPCILEISLSNLFGEVFVCSNSGNWRKIPLDEEILSDDIALFLPAPLPLNVISQILFKTKEDQQKFFERASDTSNVDHTLIPTKILKTLFTKTSSFTCTPSTPPLMSNRDVFPAKSLAVGGVLAMLYHVANLSDLGVDTFQSSSAGQEVDLGVDLIKYPILAKLPSWIMSDKISHSEEMGTRIFWGVVGSLVDASSQDQRSRYSVDIVVDYLEQVLQSIHQNHAHKDFLKKIITDLRDIKGLGPGTVSSLLDKHPKPVSRSLLLFALLDTSRELFDFFAKEKLNDEDLICATILFGIRDRWLGLPIDIRVSKEFSLWVSWCMATLAQGEDGLSLGASPRRPRPLRELFQVKNKKWSKKQEEVALDICRRKKWTDLLETEICIKEEFFQPQLKKGECVFILEGDSPAITRVNHDEFMQRLCSWPPVDKKIEKQIRAQLDTKK